MSQLPSLYREVYRLDRIKPVNLRFCIDTRNLHPYVEQGRLQEFARRNGKRLERLESRDRKHARVSVHAARRG